MKKKIEELEKRIEALEKRNITIVYPPIPYQQLSRCNWCGRTNPCGQIHITC